MECVIQAVFMLCLELQGHPVSAGIEFPLASSQGEHTLQADEGDVMTLET